MTVRPPRAEGATPFLRASAPPREPILFSTRRRGDAEREHCSFLQLNIHALFAGMAPFTASGLAFSASTKRLSPKAEARLSATFNFLNLFPAVTR